MSFEKIKQGFDVSQSDDNSKGNVAVKHVKLGLNNVFCKFAKTK